MKTLNEILSFKKILHLSEKAVKNIEIAKNKMSCLINASKAFNDKDYKSAILYAQKGLISRIEIQVSPQQHDEKLYNVLYLSYYILKDYKNAQEPCLRYMISLKEKLKVNLDPKIDAKLQAALTKAEGEFAVINASLSSTPVPSFWQPSARHEAKNEKQKIKSTVKNTNSQNKY